MKNLFVILTIAASALLPTACKQVTVTPTPITPLYSTLDDFKSMDSIARDSVMKADAAQIKAFMQVVGCDSVTDSALVAWSRSRVVEAFTPEVRKVYPTLGSLETMLSIILDNAKNQGLELPRRNYAAVVWGLQKSIVFNDSTMMIALNHYLGNDYEGYQGWPEYLRMGKTPERLPYDIVEALIASQYPYQQTDSSTVLSRIVYEGALTLAKIRIVPEGSLQHALGYDNAQLQWLDDHQSELWQNMVGKKLVYSTSEDTMHKLIDPAPSTSLLSPYSPGRVGRYLGYCIIVSYLQSNTIDKLPTLLSPEFYNNPRLLIESAYGG
ncbi:MAG: hypothetical protein K2M19_02670 [Muribaculaceae bacterium]|nr:hypothetical protein [Muribaculaceae bacterium]